MLQVSPEPTAISDAPRDRLLHGPDTLFVYGTLQFDDVLRALLGRVPATRAATANGWRAAALKGRVYPGLIPSGQQTASGLLLTDLSDTEWRILDNFEDDSYELQQLPLAAGSHGWAYLWPGHDVLPLNWDASAFRSDHLTAYVARCAARRPTLLP
ncbi:gamma-glutamylcyclotransferase family protein [Streptomyces sp. NPDC059070]|uniref:gamma-glutamylcyclotransferase family protein n=1 Tax=Streptomyces sp. NPDC059070 TaxID=3346713 RepID=UPI0036BDF0BC